MYVCSISETGSDNGAVVSGGCFDRVFQRDLKKMFQESQKKRRVLEIKLLRTGLSGSEVNNRFIANR